jgi:hypothetical protein
MRDLVGDAPQQASCAPHPFAAQDDHVRAHLSCKRDDLRGRLSSLHVLLDRDVVGAETRERAVQGDVGLEVGTPRGGFPPFSGRGRSGPRIRHRYHVQGGALQPRELDRPCQGELGGGRPIGPDNDGAVDRSSSARVPRTVTPAAAAGKVPPREP